MSGRFGKAGAADQCAREQAQGILIAALGVLAAHFGYVETKRAS